MKASNIYVYFNDGGNLVSKAPYVDGGIIRQGSDFVLNLLFNKTLNLENCLIQLTFKCPGQEKPNIFPFLSYYDGTEKEIKPVEELITNPFTQMGVITFPQDLTRYGISKNTEYQMWSFDTSVAKLTDVLTEVDGNLEAQVRITNAENKDIALGTIKIFIERTVGYESPYAVSKPDLDRFISEVKEIAGQIASDLMPEQYITDIVTEESQYSMTIEKYTKKTDSLILKEVVLPLPTVTPSVNVKTLDDSENARASVIGSGKTDDPLSFSFEIPKGKDGTGVYNFEIAEDGCLYLYAQNIEDLNEEDYMIDETTGELIVYF